MKWFVEKLIGVPEEMWYPDEQTRRPHSRIQRTVDLLRQHRICYLWDIVQRQDWDIFLALAQDLPPSILITHGTPDHWPRPRNVEIIVWPAEMWTHAEQLRLMRLQGLTPPPKPFGDPDHSFSLAFAPQDIHLGETAQNRDPGRLAWIKTAYDHGLLDRARYSTPAIRGEAIQVSDAPDGYPIHSGSVPLRYFDEPQSRESMMRTEHSTQSLRRVTEGCWFHVLLDSEYDQPRCRSLGLRHLQALTVGRPVYAVTTPDILAEMHRWGIQTINDRAPRGLWSQIYRSQAFIARNIKQAPHTYWQEHHGQQALHNWQLIRDLPSRIESWVWDQCGRTGL